MFLKEVLFGKVFPIDYLFKATLKHCCDVIIIHFGLYPNHIQAQNFSPPMAKPVGSPLLLEEWYRCISCGVCHKRTMIFFLPVSSPMACCLQDHMVQAAELLVLQLIISRKSFLFQTSIELADFYDIHKQWAGAIY